MATPLDRERGRGLPRGCTRAEGPPPSRRTDSQRLREYAPLLSDMDVVGETGMAAEAAGMQATESNVDTANEGIGGIDGSGGSSQGGDGGIPVTTWGQLVGGGTLSWKYCGDIRGTQRHGR